MNSTFIDLLLNKIDSLKLVKAAVDSDEAHRFIATCDAASDLDEYDCSLNGYSLSDYKLANALSAVVLPRMVKLQSSYGMLNLEASELNTGDIMTPGEFKEFQLKLYNQFKKVPEFGTDLAEASRPVLLADVTDCIATETGVLCQGVPSRRPITLTFTFCKSGIGEVSWDEFNLELVHSLIAKIRA